LLEVRLYRLLSASSDVFQCLASLFWGLPHRSYAPTHQAAHRYATTFYLVGYQRAEMLTLTPPGFS
jgi:hypothetical protein